MKAAWIELAAALGQETWGGRTVGDGALVGLGLLGWDSLEVCICSKVWHLVSRKPLTINRRLELLSESPRRRLLCRSGRVSETRRVLLLS